jgi:hypothetical protein
MSIIVKSAESGCEMWEMLHKRSITRDSSLAGRHDKRAQHHRHHRQHRIHLHLRHVRHLHLISM